MKLFFKILHQRRFIKCEKIISDLQFGLRQMLGMREAIVTTHVLVQNSCNQGKNVALCFIDMRKPSTEFNGIKILKS